MTSSSYIYCSVLYFSLTNPETDPKALFTKFPRHLKTILEAGANRNFPYDPLDSEYANSVGLQLLLVMRSGRLTVGVQANCIPNDDSVRACLKRQQNSSFLRRNTTYFLWPDFCCTWLTHIIPITFVMARSTAVSVFHAICDLVSPSPVAQPSLVALFVTPCARFHLTRCHPPSTLYSSREFHGGEDRRWKSEAPASNSRSSSSTSLPNLEG